MTAELWGWSIGIALLAIACIGFAWNLKDEYFKQLQQTDNKPKAILLAINEYFVLQLGKELLQALIVFPFLIFLVGGLVGLLILGWREVLRLI